MFLAVVGAGRIGTRIIELALADDHNVIVFDKDQARCERAAQLYDVIAFNVDATRERALIDAEVDRADGLIAATRDDPVNLMVMSLGRKLKIPKLVSVVNHAEAMPLFEARGVLTVGNPSELAAVRLLHSLMHPGVRDYLDVGDGVEIFKVEVGAGNAVSGSALAGLPLPDDVLVAAIERAGAFIIPRGDTTILSGDVVTLLARGRHIDELVRVFGG